MFCKKRVLFHVGDVCKCFYIALKGNYTGLLSNNTVRYIYGEYDIMGLEDFFLERQTRVFSLLVDPNCDALVLEIKPTNFGSLAKRDFAHLYTSLYSSCLLRNQFLLSHKANELDVPRILLEDNKKKEVKDGEDLDSANLYIILEGAIESPFGVFRRICCPLTVSCRLRAIEHCVLLELNFEKILHHLKELKPLLLWSLERFEDVRTPCFLKRYYRSEKIQEHLVLKYIYGQKDRKGHALSECLCLLSKEENLRRDLVAAGNTATCRTICILNNGNFFDYFISRFRGDSIRCCVFREWTAKNVVVRERLRNDYCFLVVHSNSSSSWRKMSLNLAETVVVVFGENEEENHQVCHLLPKSSKYIRRYGVNWCVQRRNIVFPKIAFLRHFDINKEDMMHINALIRVVQGKTLGIVLSGHCEGIASYAYYGAMEAFRDNNVPFDVIGGNYSGGFVGAMYAMDLGKRRICYRIRSSMFRFSFFDPFIDMLLYFVDYSYSFSSRLQNVMDVTFSKKASNGSLSLIRFEDLPNKCFVSLTSLRNCKNVIRSEGIMSEVLTDCMRMPLVMEGHYFCGSFSNPSPVQEARDLGCYKVIHMNANCQMSGRMSGGFLYNFLFNQAHSTLSHLAVCSALAGGSKDSDYNVSVDLDDVHWDDVSKVEEVAKRGYDAAVQVMESMRKCGDLHNSDLVVSNDLSHVHAPFRTRYARIIKVIGVVTLGVLVIYYVRKKAYEMEQHRMEEFLKGEEMIHTTYVEK